MMRNIKWNLFLPPSLLRQKMTGHLLLAAPRRNLQRSLQRILNRFKHVCLSVCPSECLCNIYGKHPSVRKNEAMGFKFGRILTHSLVLKMWQLGQRTRP